MTPRLSSFVQSIDNAHEERVGREGVAPAALRDALARADKALAWLRARHADGGLRLLQLPAERDDIPQILAAARKLTDGARDLVFLGTGGSSLGAQALAQLADYAVPGLGVLRAEPRVHFMDNLDAGTFAAFLAKIDLAGARFVAVSKSGGTAETLIQLSAVIASLQQAGLQSRVPQTIMGLTEPAKPGGRNNLRTFLTGLGCECLDHDTGIGGRYSVLSNVGLLPAAVLGLDIAAIREGAAETLAPVFDGAPASDVPSALGAALSVALSETRGKRMTVLMAYADRLERFTKWYAQLWAESLGKDGKGTTPVAALGPVDQHSQLQLYIGGPRDKLFTVMTVGASGRGSRIPADIAKAAGEAVFAGKTIGDLVAAEGRATAETLAKNGCPVRTFHVETLNEKSLGALLMHFMLETIVAAQLIGVDAFDQPAVEEGKVLAKKYLAS
jgi:glucose-6-phosphate isomerase